MIKPITDLSLGAAADAVVDAVPVGAEGAIVFVHDTTGLPLAYEVEFGGLAGDVGLAGRVETILHEELEVVWSPP